MTQKISVPSQYQSYVSAAAKATGIPEAVVAAQIQLESSWNPQAVSPAGAEGIAQFEPGTFSEYGSGSPFDVADAFQAYAKYMAALLKQEKGDLTKTLEAYNAGPGNLAAGSGYAESILAAAKTNDSTIADWGADAFSDSKDDSGSLFGVAWPTQITSFFTKGVDDLTTLSTWFAAFTKPSTYVRIGAGVGGVVFIIFGIVCLAIETRNS